MTADDLRDLGVSSIGHRRRILNALEELDLARSVDGSSPIVDTELPETSRRQVSVLFADISGFTRLSSERDPEEVHAILNQFFATVGDVVTRFGGTVDKHIGDAVMAVFGASIAHTDDPERALRAAQDIHATVAQLDPPMQVHIGVASGQVIASATGGAVHTEYTVTGDSVNLAARLTDLAKAQETFASDSVRRAIGEAFVGTSIGERLIEGLPEPMSVWRLDGIADPREIGRRPFVGRRAECAEFEAGLARCQTRGAGEVYIVRGEAGIGKTRLIDELDRLASANGFSTHTGLVLDFGTAKGQDAVRAITRSLLGLTPGTNKEARAETADQAIAMGILTEERRAYLNDLLDLEQTPALRGLYDAMDNQTRNAGKQGTLAALVRNVGARQPILVKIEDLHWADPIVLAHAASLSQVTADANVILLLTTRLTGDPFDATWREACGSARISGMELGPMPPEDAGALARSFPDIDDDMKSNCLERAGGNPLLLEQLLYNADQVVAGELPGSVQSIVQARLDALRKEDRGALQAASVLGQRFSRAAVEAMTGVMDFQPEVLLGQALIRRAGSDYHFAHALIREGVYSSLLSAQRIELHRRAAAHFDGRDPDLHAQHLDQAGDPDAPVAYLAAAQIQRDRLRFDAALGSATRALELETPRRLRFELACFRGDLLRDLGRSEDAVDAFEMALSLAESDVDQCCANLGLASAMRIVDRVSDAFACLDRAQTLADPTQKDMLAQIHFLRGNLLFPQGQIEACLEQHEASLNYAREAGSDEAIARALGGLGDANYAAGKMRQANAYFRECVDVAAAGGLRRIEIANMPMTAWTTFFMGDLDGADQTADATIEMAAAISESRSRIVAYNLKVEISRLRGDFDAVRRDGEYCIALIEEIGAIRFLPSALMALALHRGSGEGDRVAAFSGISEAYDIARETENAETFLGPWVLGRAALLAPDLEGRQWALAEGDRILETGAVSHNYFLFYADAIDACLEAGDYDGAVAYSESLAKYAGKDIPDSADFFVRRARALHSVTQESREANLSELTDLAAFATERGFNMSLKRITAAIDEVSGATG